MIMMINNDNDKYYYDYERRIFEGRDEKKFLTIKASHPPNEKNNEKPPIATSHLKRVFGRPACTPAGITRKQKQ
jgi:hypothetical protein